MDMQEEVKKLREENVALQARVRDLEQLVDMYDRLARAEDMELSDAYTTLEAQESAQELSRQELDDAYRTIQAHESASEKARQELDNAYKTIQAHEILEEHSRQKKLNRQELTDG